MPTIRPFRALRYDPDAVGDLASVVSPPADEVGQAEARELLARHPRNVVRLGLALAQPGDEPDERYRRAAHTYAAWRADGTLHRDRRPSVYAYEQAYRLPGTNVERLQRGFFARLKLEAPGPGTTIHALERAAPDAVEESYRLLRASGANLSPIVALYRDPSGASLERLGSIASRPPDAEVTDEAGTRHRLWAVPDVALDPEAPADGKPDAGTVDELVAVVGSGTVTIVDGAAAYEAALRYRSERRTGRPEADEPFDDVLALLLAEEQSPGMLPLHRVVTGLGPFDASPLEDALTGLFQVSPTGREELLARFGRADGRGGGGRFGLWTAGGGTILEARRDAFARLLPPGGDAFRRLDATLLHVAIERMLAGVAEDAPPRRVAVTASAAEAIDRVDGCVDGAGAAFLVEPTPVADLCAVARDGDQLPERASMPYPRPLSGLVLNPHEW